ncbi:RsmE family RNA methyltransferase [Pseudodesulfovibrio pelocollis]|uniref:RsmE family RNA methyltransferase n=1 Tax=Pseudodesulfovibrio pelocollis TaxID=3051432 RepID=UPI00255AF847|nr:RsmE family RNA methyltransferase [Pseudodesulfovibrio sp. SB368]
MARLNSFHLPPGDWPEAVGESVRLAGAEARHMLTVLRTAPHHTVRLFDGLGRVGLFTVLDTDRNTALLRAERLAHHPVPDTGLTLAIGWGKSKRREYLFEKLVELGGLGVAFWAAARSQGQMPGAVKETWTDKCVQAAKQCGNPLLPALSVLPGGLDGLIDFARGFDTCYVAWESEDIDTPLAPAHLAQGRSLVIIGPEGGFDDAEARALLAAGLVPVTLGRSILRWETAATYCLSLGWFARQGMQ